MDRLRPIDDATPPPPKHRRTTLVAGTVAGAMVALAVVALTVGRWPTSASAPAPGSDAPAPIGPLSTEPPCDETAGQLDPAERVGPVDTDADGCAETVVVKGQVIEVGARRFAAGVDGDQVLVGDWDCDGQATPALLRPASGEVFVFTTWAEPGTPAMAPRVAVVPGGATLAAEPRGDTPSSCPRLSVRRHSGPPVPVDPSPSPPEPSLIPSQEVP